MLKSIAEEVTVVMGCKRYNKNRRNGGIHLWLGIAYS